MAFLRIKIAWWKFKARITGKPARIGWSVGEVAEKTGMFPSDVEKTFKEFREKGLVKCFMYKNQLYAVPTEKLENKDISEAMEELQSDGKMYR